MTFRTRTAPRILWLLGAGVALLVSVPAIASNDISVFVDGLGTTKANAAITVKAYSLGYSVPLDPATSTRRLQIAPVTITKDLDDTTPVLMKSGTDTVFKTVTLTARNTTAAPASTTTITLTNARITDWRVVDTARITTTTTQGTTTSTGGGLPTEQVTFAADTMTVNHQVVGRDGQPEGAAVSGTVGTKQ